MVITLTPEIEQALNTLAKQQGTTVEFLALKALRERLLLSPSPSNSFQAGTRYAPHTLADFLTGHVGVLDSDECMNEESRLSTNTSRRFADILLEKRRNGRL